jgi:hypothetical protein
MAAVLLPLRHKTAALLSEYGVLEYLSEHWEILHTQGRQWLVEDIDEFIKARDKYYQIVSKKDDEAFPRHSLGNLEVTVPGYL